MKKDPRRLATAASRAATLSMAALALGLTAPARAVAKAPFNLLMRLYWPKAAVLNGTCTPPAVQPANGRRRSSTARI